MLTKQGRCLMGTVVNVEMNNDKKATVFQQNEGTFIALCGYSL